ncbi:MAG: hypothetical protein CM1200mP33_6400 [Chloroflexota bacterium]|nr:MAG: hypothetical protein CM1200mP33_6400 [Chloroflexota bacterium]
MGRYTFRVEFSYNSEGDWNFINKRNLKIPLNSMVEQIGESEQDIWIKQMDQYIIR